MAKHSPSWPPALASRRPEDYANLPTPPPPYVIGNCVLTPLIEEVFVVAKERLKLHADLDARSLVEGVGIIQPLGQVFQEHRVLGHFDTPGRDGGCRSLVGGAPRRTRVLVYLARQIEERADRRQRADPLSRCTEGFPIDGLASSSLESCRK